MVSLNLIQKELPQRLIMKKNVFTVLAGAVLGCALAAATVFAADVSTVSEGKLKVATSPDFAPYEFYHIDENGDYTGGNVSDNLDEG